MDYEDFCVEAAPAGAWMLEALREVPCTNESGWFIAGGSVLRALMTDEKATLLLRT